MTPGSFRFDNFVLDSGDRQLLRDGQPVELNSRYLDALGLLVREQGRLVSKDRFMDEVWRGVPVTDEALTQCIRTLRRQLGDDVSRPRFIETVPKHGYRFIADVQPAAEAPSATPTRSTKDWAKVGALGGAATVGGGMAGFIGGLIYGFAAASHPDAGAGALSILLVVQCLSIAVAMMGGAGVGFGIALAGTSDWRRSVLGGALGGLFVGGLVKLLGIDAFHLLFGEAPSGITGGMEGALLGAAVGLGVWYAMRGDISLRRGAAVSALVGASAGLVIPLLGGTLMAGSLDLLAHTFQDSSLRLDSMSGLFGDHGFGLTTRLVTGALEGALFAGCVAAAVKLASRGMISRG
ncbi:MAG TPA: winged helix-turn-helix domain-containing protein [Sphingomicrobium sp.]